MSFGFYYTIVFILVAFFAIEISINIKEHKHLYKRNDTLNNIFIGLGLFFISFISRGFVLSSYYFIYSVRIFTINNGWATWVFSFLLCDFSYYWYHRISHNVNWLWSAHSVHHSSEHFNVSVSFRQSWLNQLSGYFLFYLWLPLLGFDPFTIYTASGLCLFYQSWLHTELIGKLNPVIEFVFNTPSHHRVHHSSDVKYLDKNHGAILIIWDRLFNTFQAEEEKPTYGLTTKLINPNVTNILLSDWKLLFIKVFSAGSFKNAMNYLVQPPGWSHNGTSKTVKELRKELLQNSTCKNCNKKCPVVLFENSPYKSMKKSLLFA